MDEKDQLIKKSPKCLKSNEKGLIEVILEDQICVELYRNI